MKNGFKYIICTILSLILLVLLAGCGGAAPNEAKIAEDLTNAGFLQERQLYGSDSEAYLPIVSITITQADKGKNDMRFMCTVLQEDNNYRVSSDVGVEYSQYEGQWNYSSYSLLNSTVEPIAGVPDEIILNSNAIQKLYEQDYSASPNNGTVYINQVDVDVIEHDFNPESKTDVVVLHYTVNNLFDVNEGDIELHYSFDSEWKNTLSETLRFEQTWKLTDLVGKTWVKRGIGLGERAFRVNSIDMASHTIDLDYGYTSLSQHEVCEFSFADSGHSGAMLVLIPLTYDFYEIRIYENQIRFGEFIMREN